MKIPFSGIICTSLLVMAGNLPGIAQEKRPEPQPTGQAASTIPPVTDGSSEQTQPASADQNPAPQQNPPQNPPAQTPPAQNPPVGQTPTTPPGEDQPQHGMVPQPPPPPPKVPDVRRPGESGFWVGVEGWFPKEQPIFNKANQSTFTESSRIKMQGKPKYAPNIEVGAAVGLHNTLRLVYTDFRAAGNLTTPVDVVLWAQTYTAGTYLSTNYHVQNLKLSYEYLTWPFPVGSRKFRLKTLWQAQGTIVSSTFDSPLDYFDSNGNRLLDASGNPINLAVSRSKNIFSPMFGLGAYYYPSRHFRFEANGSGFGFPHKYTIWDADATLNMRLTGHLEVRVGGRAFSFKSSTNADYYIRGTFASAFFGLRWYSNSE